jgi:hypothetical protein
MMWKNISSRTTTSGTPRSQRITGMEISLRFAASR